MTEEKTIYALAQDGLNAWQLKKARRAFDNMRKALRDLQDDIEDMQSALQEEKVFLEKNTKNIETGWTTRSLGQRLLRRPHPARKELQERLRAILLLAGKITKNKGELLEKTREYYLKLSDPMIKKLAARFTSDTQDAMKHLFSFPEEDVTKIKEEIVVLEAGPGEKIDITILWGILESTWETAVEAERVLKQIDQLQKEQGWLGHFKKETKKVPTIVFTEQYFLLDASYLRAWKEDPKRNFSSLTYPENSLFLMPEAVKKECLHKVTQGPRKGKQLLTHDEFQELLTALPVKIISDVDAKNHVAHDEIIACRSFTGHGQKMSDERFEQSGDFQILARAFEYSENKVPIRILSNDFKDIGNIQKHFGTDNFEKFVLFSDYRKVQQ